MLFAYASFVISGCGEAPAVPHSFTSVSVDSCRTCHQSEDSGAPLVDHSDRNNCLRCHDGKPVVAYEKKDTNKTIRL